MIMIIVVENKDATRSNDDYCNDDSWMMMSLGKNEYDHNVDQNDDDDQCWSE